MKASLALIALWLAMAAGQTVPACSADLVRSDDCTDVIDANACYNEFRWSGTQSLQCIGGANNTERARKVRFHGDSRYRVY
jgi:hypothetical protein